MPESDAPTHLCSRHAQEAFVCARHRPLEAAHRRTGIVGGTELVTTGLALLAAQDDFGTWLAGQRGALTDGFEIGV